MDYNTAKILLDRYFEGNSSLAEEAALRSYFQQENLPPDMEPYRPLFQFFAEAGKQTPSKAFTDRLEAMKGRAPTKIVRLRQPLTRWLAIAAMVTMGLMVWMLAPKGPEPSPQAAIDWSQYEPKSEEEAIRITTAALQKTSSSLRRGMRIATDELQSVKKLVQPW